MVVEDLVDLGAVHILATGDDHVLGAVDAEQVTLLVHEAEVAAVVPPVAKDGGVSGLFQ